jgi:uncharacterized membrane protein YgcG
MRRVLAIGASLLASLWLWAAPAGAATLADCLAHQHVCVSSSGRALISTSQEARLEHQIDGSAIYLVLAPAPSSGYNSAMRQIRGDLSGHGQFTVGFLDTRRLHFGAYNKGMLPPHGAADIASAVVQQHRADRNIFAALTEFVKDVQREAGSSAGTGTGGGAASAPSHVLRNALIVVGVVVLLAVLGFLLIARPIRRRRQRELSEAKTAAQDDLIALSAGIADHGNDLSIVNNPEAAQEQAAALSAYERGTAGLDAARRVSDMTAVSRAIGEGQYHLACAEALAAGKPRPDRRPSCFFDPRHGMSVRDVYWTPPDGGVARTVPACAADAHKVDQGIEPEVRQVEVAGRPVNYMSAGFAPAYWGGYGFLPGMFTGFLLGEALAPFPFGYTGDQSYGDDGSGGDDFGGGDYGGGDFGGGDYGGDDFGGGDYGGGDFGGGDCGGGGDFS